MSTDETNEIGRNIRVIGRAYGDEPIVLVVLSDWGNAIEVRREEDRDSIGFRKEALYRFDQALFDKLHNAFIGGKREALMRLWSGAESYR